METERQILCRDFGWTQLISGKGEKNHIENRWRDDRWSQGELTGWEVITPQVECILILQAIERKRSQTKYSKFEKTICGSLVRTVIVWRHKTDSLMVVISAVTEACYYGLLPCLCLHWRQIHIYNYMKLWHTEKKKSCRFSLITLVVIIAAKDGHVLSETSFPFDCSI